MAGPRGQQSGQNSEWPDSSSQAEEVQQWAESGSDAAQEKETFANRENQSAIHEFRQS